MFGLFQFYIYDSATGGIYTLSLQDALLMWARKHFGSHGISADGLSMDVGAMMKRKDGVVRKMARGIDFLMNKNGIERVAGLGRIAGPNEVEVTSDGGQQCLKAKRILIATDRKSVV